MYKSFINFKSFYKCKHMIFYFKILNNTCLLIIIQVDMFNSAPFYV